jgi:hypothetical protein
VLCDPRQHDLLVSPPVRSGEKLSCAGGDTPFVAVIQKVNVPLTVGLPLIVAVPLWLSTNVTPAGSDPAGEKVRVGTGIPVAVTVNEPIVPV